MKRRLEHFLGATSNARIERLLARSSKRAFPSRKPWASRLRTASCPRTASCSQLRDISTVRKRCSLPSVPIGSQTSLICSIISHPLRVHDGGDRRMLVNGPTPLEIDANLETFRMETLRPVEGFRTFKIMPLHTSHLHSQDCQTTAAIPLQPRPKRASRKILSQCNTLRHDIES